jgi:hypothetical protein
MKSRLFALAFALVIIGLACQRKPDAPPQPQAVPVVEKEDRIRYTLDTLTREEAQGLAAVKEADGEFLFTSNVKRSFQVDGFGQENLLDNEIVFHEDSTGFILDGQDTTDFFHYVVHFKEGNLPGMYTVNYEYSIGRLYTGGATALVTPQGTAVANYACGVTSCRLDVTRSPKPRQAHSALKGGRKK